jgi:hypothetical protein
LPESRSTERDDSTRDDSTLPQSLAVVSLRYIESAGTRCRIRGQEFGLFEAIGCPERQERRHSGALDPSCVHSKMSGTSMLDPRWRRLARLRLYCNASCIAAIVVGCLVLCGWIVHIELLKSAFLGSASIEANTSVGLILLGMSLWLLLPAPPRRAHRYGGLLLGTLVASMGAITISEYVLGLDMQIDQLFLREGLGVIVTHSLGECRL